MFNKQATHVQSDSSNLKRLSSIHLFRAAGEKSPGCKI